MVIIPVGSNKELWEFIRVTRNNDQLKHGFIQQNHITPLEQEQYMSVYSHCYYVCLVDGEPVGYVGVVDNDIRVAVDPTKQRLGVASFMLDYIKQHYPKAQAKIKVDNEASLKLFQKAGYVTKFYLLELQEE